jgi:hypothetical protein
VLDLHARGARIFVSLDGASSNDNHRLLLQRECEAIVTQFEEDGLVFESRIAKVNLGCRAHIRDAVTWFFERNFEGLIVEEDLVLSPNSFKFIKSTKHYLLREDIFALCLFSPLKPRNTAYLVNHWNPWVWYSNAYKWRQFVEYIDKPIIPKYNFRSRFRRLSVRIYLRNIVKGTIKGEIDTWDAQVHAAMIVKRMYCVFPKKNLSLHVGYDSVATHSGLLNVWPEKELDLERTTFRSYSLNEELDEGVRLNRRYENAFKMTLISLSSAFAPTWVLKIWKWLKLYKKNFFFGI